MPDKVCFKCQRTLAIEDFYRHPMMADGHLGKCKDCTKHDVSNYWHEHAKVLRQTDASRRKAQQRTAHTAVSNALRDKRCRKPAHCHYCGATGEVEAHHWTYYRPLDVTWVCHTCHRIADMARRDAEVAITISGPF